MAATGKTRAFFAVTAVVLVSFLLFQSDKKSKEAAAIVSVDRSGEVLFTNNRSDQGKDPFILEARIISEKSSEVVFDIKYFMTENTKGQYGISIYPADTHDWQYDMNTLRTGLNNQTIKVSFQTDIPFAGERESRFMTFHINKHNQDGASEKVFTRKVDFPKTWVQ